MRIAMIDNYDSFTYNLVQYLSEAGATVEVVRNDAVSSRRLVYEKYALGLDALVCANEKIVDSRSHGVEAIRD